MDDQDFDNETLMAFADGELDAETSAHVAQAVQNCPALAERLSLFTGTRAALADVAAAVRAQPPSDALLHRVRNTIAEAGREDRGDSVKSLIREWPPHRVFLPAAIAASCAGFGLIAGFALAPADDAPQLTLLPAAGLSDALDRIPSGKRTVIADGEIEVIASFLTADDTFCREFELHKPDDTTVTAVACRTGPRTDVAWSARFAVTNPADDGTSFTPASSLEVLDTYLATIGAGAAMNIEEEAQLLIGPDR